MPWKPAVCCVTQDGVSGGNTMPMHSYSQQMSDNYEYFSEPRDFFACRAGIHLAAVVNQRPLQN